MGMNAVSTSIPASNRSVLSVYEMDRLNNIRRRDLERSKVEDKTIVQIVGENYRDARIIQTKDGDFIDSMAGLENVQFYLAKIDLSTKSIIEIGLPATKNSDGSVYFLGANELRIGKDVFELNDQLHSQGFAWVLIGKDETNTSKFNINEDLKTGPDSVITQLSPYVNPTNFDAGHENLRKGQDNFFSKPVDNFCISCGGGAKKESLDVIKADYSAATTSDAPNTYSLAAVDLYRGETGALISLDFKLVPTIFVASPVPQQFRQVTQFSPIFRNMDINKTDGGFFLVWNAVSYTEPSRNMTSNSDSAMPESPFYIDKTSDSIVVFPAKKEQNLNQIFDGIQNLKFFHISEEVSVMDIQNLESSSDRSTLVCFTPESSKQYILKLSRFSPQEESQIMRLLMNPTERKLWGKLFGLPDEDDARQVYSAGETQSQAMSRQQAQQTSRVSHQEQKSSISLSVSKAVSQPASISRTSNTLKSAVSETVHVLQQSNSMSQPTSHRVPQSSSQVSLFTSPFSEQKPEHKTENDQKKWKKKEEKEKLKQEHSSSSQRKSEDRKDKKDSDKGTGFKGKTDSSKKKEDTHPENKKTFDFLGMFRKGRKITPEADEDEEGKKGNFQKPKEDKKTANKPKGENQKPEMKKHEKKDEKTREDVNKDTAKNEIRKENKKAKKIKLTEEEKTERKIKTEEAKKAKTLKLTEDKKEEKKKETKKKREKMGTQRVLPEKKEYGIKKSVASRSKKILLVTKKQSKKKSPSFLLRWILARKKRRTALPVARS